MDSLKLRVADAGHEIISVCQRPLGPECALIEQADMLIVNGEGTFRDEASNFEPGRHDLLFDGMSLAKQLGKSVYLTNTVWCRMSERWGPLLAILDGISTREPESTRQVQTLCGRIPEVHPDEAFFLPVNKYIASPWFPPYQIVIGDFYHNAEGVSDSSLEFEGLPRMGLLSNSWEQVVSSLSPETLYVTGQHHGVYAACKAKSPFAACRVNTHKLTSLFEWAGVEIPLASNMQELQEAILFAETHPDEFDKLFTFLESQTAWPIPAT